MELVHGLNLHHSQRHRCAMTDAMEGDLLDMHRDIMQAVVEERASGVDGRRSHIHRQLEVLQLHHQG